MIFRYVNILIFLIYRYWLARPDKYKTSIISNDDTTGSSNLVEVAINYNMGEIKREVAITYQGTPTHGFYEWVNVTAVGGDEAYNCDFIDITIQIVSQIYGVLSNSKYSEPFETVFQEGEYPIESTVSVLVGSEGSDMTEIYNGNVQNMIENNLDQHIRGSSEGSSGFAYIYEADLHPMFGPSCDSPSDNSDDILLVQW